MLCFGRSNRYLMLYFGWSYRYLGYILGDKFVMFRAMFFVTLCNIFFCYVLGDFIVTWLYYGRSNRYLLLYFGWSYRNLMLSFGRFKRYLLFNFGWSNRYIMLYFGWVIVILCYILGFLMVTFALCYIVGNLIVSLLDVLNDLRSCYSVKGLP